MAGREIPEIFKIPEESNVVILNGHGVDFLAPKNAAVYVGHSKAWVRRLFRSLVVFTRVVVKYNIDGKALTAIGRGTQIPGIKFVPKMTHRSAP